MFNIISIQQPQICVDKVAFYNLKHFKTLLYLHKFEAADDVEHWNAFLLIPNSASFTESAIIQEKLKIMRLLSSAPLQRQFSSLTTFHLQAPIISMLSSTVAAVCLKINMFEYCV